MATQKRELTCTEAVQRLDDYVDRELTADKMEAVRAHLATCAHCAEQFAFEAAVLSEIRDRIQRIRYPEDLTERIARSLSSAPPDRPA